MLNFSKKVISLINGRDKMKKTILNIVSVMLFYLFGIIGFFLFFVFFGVFGVIDYYSAILFDICFIWLPIIILGLPIILIVFFRKGLYRSILNTIILSAAYFLFVFTVNFGICKYMSSYTFEKWCNDSYHGLRYLMIEDLEKKYDFIGMRKEDVIEILGKEYENEDYIYYFIRSEWLKTYYYCLQYDSNNIIVKVYINLD